MTKLLDLTGQKFNRLIVLKRAENNKLGKVCWLCKCECGNIIIVESQNLRTNHTKSCGCLNEEQRSKTGKIYGKLNGKINGQKQKGVPKIKNRKYKNLTYDKTFKRIRNIYRCMIRRCYNKNATGYKNWGGRGIIICDEWKNNFENFYNWAITNGFDAEIPWYNCTIDRINNDGNYEPSNCRFATAKQQRNNQRIYSSSPLSSLRGKTLRLGIRTTKKRANTLVNCQRCNLI